MWICHHAHIFQYPVLAVCWSEHIPGDEDADHVALCDVDAVDAVSDLLLDHGAVVVHCAFGSTRISLCFRISLSIIGMFFFLSCFGLYSHLDTF